MQANKMHVPYCRKEYICTCHTKNYEVVNGGEGRILNKIKGVQSRKVTSVISREAFNAVNENASGFLRTNYGSVLARSWKPNGPL